MKPTHLALVVLSLALAAAPALAQASAPSSATNNTTGYDTADKLWAHIHEGPKGRTAPELQTYFRQLNLGLTEFITSYPGDPRSWQAKVFLASVDLRLAATDKSIDLANDQETLKQVIDSPDAPQSAKTGARFQQIAMQFRTGAQNASLPAEVEAFARDYPNDPRIASLDAIEYQCLQKSDPAAADALLDRLLNSSDPHVVEFAKGKQIQRDVTKKPLDLKYTAVDGTEVDLAKLRGKVVLVDFWATWCGPCMREVPDVVQVYQADHQRGFEVVGVSLDQDKSKVLAVTKEKGMVWPQYFDGQGWNNKISASYGIQSIPTMWLVNKQGMVIDLNARDNLKGKVEQLLAE